MKAPRVILVGGLVAGTLDLVAAILTSSYYGRSPVWLLQLIASGLLGAAAFEGGAPAAALGAVCHFAIATGATAAYYAMSRRWPALVLRPMMWGAAYGVAVYAVMNLVVLPLSAYPFPPSFPIVSLIRGLLVHIVCVGLPIAWVVRTFGRGDSLRRAERAAASTP